MPDLLIGCPVRNRAWILPRWFAHVDRACAFAEVEAGFVFVGDPAADPETWAAIERCAGARPLRPVVMSEPALPPLVEDHAWNPARFTRMVELRNELLSEVRAMAPRWFLSLDSDVLVHPELFVQLLDTAARYDAVGGKTYMTPGSTVAPSYALIERGTLVRHEFHGVAPVDVIMAIKLMSPPAYGVDYVWHHQGEDVGWSLAARAAGLRLGFNATVVSKHVMDPARLDVLDVRVGF